MSNGVLCLQLQELSVYLNSKEVSTVEIKEIKHELRDFKQRETRLLTDYAELEEENIMLQKQISNLRSSQVRSFIETLHIPLVQVPFMMTISSF